MENPQDNTPQDVHRSGHPYQREARAQAVAHRKAALKEAIANLAREDAAAGDDVDFMRFELEHLGRHLDRAAVELDALKQLRDELVVEASIKHELPRRYVALATLLTPGRVQQIVDANR